MSGEVCFGVLPPIFKDSHMFARMNEHNEWDELQTRAFVDEAIYVLIHISLLTLQLIQWNPIQMHFRLKKRGLILVIVIKKNITIIYK